MGDWVNVRRIYMACTRIQMNIYGLLRGAEGPRLLCWAGNTAKLGNWRPSTTDITISSATDRHLISSWVMRPMCSSVCKSESSMGGSIVGGLAFI